MQSIPIQFNSEIAKDNEEVRIAFYANIGFFIEVAQMLEFNLRKLLCYERSVKEIEQEGVTKENVTRICKKYDEYYDQTYAEKWTLGKLKGELGKSTVLMDEIMEDVKEINEYRIMLVHKIFQINIDSGNLGSSEIVGEYINQQLVPMTNKAEFMNKLLISVIEAYRDDLRAYKEQVGFCNS